MISKKSYIFAENSRKGIFESFEFLNYHITLMTKQTEIVDYRLTEDGWFAYEYQRPALTADCVIFGFDGQTLNVLLVKRGIEPYKNKWAFPGGFLRMNETIAQCAQRELTEETNFKQIYMEEFGVFSDVHRDPRGRVITTAFYALAPMQEVQGADDAAEAKWFRLDNVPALAFDHDHILRIAYRRLREDLHFRPVGFELLPETFTMPQLQRLYEAILDVHFDRRNFMKKMLATGILEDTGTKEENTAHRAATYYRFNQSAYQQFKNRRNFNLEF